MRPQRELVERIAHNVNASAALTPALIAEIVEFRRLGEQLVELHNRAPRRIKPSTYLRVQLLRVMRSSARTRGRRIALRLHTRERRVRRHRAVRLRSRSGSRGDPSPGDDDPDDDLTAAPLVGGAV